MNSREKPPQSSQTSALWGLFCAQLRVGCFGFGGPLATMGMMREEICIKRKLLPEEKHLLGLGVVKLLPGPMSSLLAVFLGCEIGGFVGGLISVIAFIGPSFLMLVSVCLLEGLFQQSGSAQDLKLLGVPLGVVGAQTLRGLQVAVLAVILQTCLTLFLNAWKIEYNKQRPRLVIAILSMASVGAAALGIAEIFILLGSSLSAWLFLSVVKPRMEAPASSQKLQVSPWSVFALFFQAGLTVFGTGYMVLPALNRMLVVDRGWISRDVFLQGMMWGNLTPGPVVITSTYLGWHMGGFWQSLAATLGIFSGPVLLMLTMYPVLKRLWGKTWIQAALVGLLPAVAMTIAWSSLGFFPALAPRAWELVTMSLFFALLQTRKLTVVKTFAVAALTWSLKALLLS